MIDIRKLKELVRLMVNNELTELDLRDSEEQVTLRRQPPSMGGQVMQVPVAGAPVAAPVAAVPAPAAAPAAGGGAEAPADDTAGLVPINSPIVGSFYSAANPDSPPFVKVGTHVDPETTVCIVEAMKIFNEIKAETTGTVERILVGNGDAVEFGQPMFLVKPD